MIRTTTVSTVLIATLLSSSALVAQSSAQVTPADAASFIGEWTLTLQGPNGPGAFELVVKVDKEKVVGQITDQNKVTNPITDVTKADKSLVLRYSFDYQGSPVATVVSLTPAADGKINAQIDFAGGAYVMSGSAAKKDKSK
jgi:hypothetical protein